MWNDDVIERDLKAAADVQIEQAVRAANHASVEAHAVTQIINSGQVFEDDAIVILGAIRRQLAVQKWGIRQDIEFLILALSESKEESHAA